MKVVCVPILQDNFTYLLIDESGVTAAVDPAQPQKLRTATVLYPRVLGSGIPRYNGTSKMTNMTKALGATAHVVDAANAEGVIVSKVLTTHKHLDHAGGNDEIARMIPGIEIVGGSTDGVQGCTKTVVNGDVLSVGSIAVRCIHTPGHTMGHICFYATEGDQKAVFTGDTLFVGGAGRFFEGRPEDMQVSLVDKLGQLPPETLVYCGHELEAYSHPTGPLVTASDVSFPSVSRDVYDMKYTAANYKFALSVDRGNEDLQREAKLASEMLTKGQHTVPSTIAKELATNPFMRAHEPALQEQTGLGEGASTADYLGRIREMKNSFRA